MKQLWQNHSQRLLFLIVSYFIWTAVSTRWLVASARLQHPQLWLLSGVLLLFGLLLGVEWFLQSNIQAHLYLTVQTLSIFIVSLFYFEIDFFALLYLPLLGQAMLRFERKTAVRWFLILCLVTIIGQIYQFDGWDVLSFTLLYLAGLVFVAIFSHITLQAQADRQRSEQLLAELKTAHEQLRDYADQAEKLAIANERNRLAKDLHDSVAQTLYGLTLQAETADRQLNAGKLTAVHTHLQQIRDSAQESLQEARLLIFELQPPILASEGLAAALQTRLDLVESRSGVRVEARLEEVSGLETAVATATYRIAQEALNNSLKHAHSNQIKVSLQQKNGTLHLEINDNGIGFDPETACGGLGLANMHERAAQIEATLTITSNKERGTTIRLEKSNTDKHR